ncbi:hypothetical protein LguiB_006437 [Lonicera macranthoides]
MRRHCGIVVRSWTAATNVEDGADSGQSREDDIDDASIWSIQVNASTRDDDDNDNDELCVEEIVEYGETDNDYKDDNGGELNELCEGMRKISVN